MRVGLVKLFWVLLFLVCSFSTSGYASSMANPNIILILVDDMGWSDIGSYGGEVSTPNIDHLAQGGLRFTQFHNTSKCFPSRATLLTGLYAQQTGMDEKPVSMRNVATIAEVLRSQGYRTLMTGKHHGTDNPVEFGFDKYIGLRDGAANHFNPGLQREGEPPPAQKKPGKRTWCFDKKCVQPYTPKEKNFYSTDYFTDKALEYLDRYRYEDKPYFLYVSYQAPHDPLQAWPEDIAKYLDKYTVGYEAIAKARFRRQQEMGLIDNSYRLPSPTHRQWKKLTADEKNDQVQRMAVYAAMIDRVDQNIGKLLEKVKAMGDQDNTLILFASDNGSNNINVEKGSGEIGSVSRWSSLGKDWANVSNTPYRFYKNHSYQGGIATPFIARWPKVIKNTGQISQFPAHFIDVMATFVDMTGASFPEKRNGEKIPGYEGQSLFPIFQGSKMRERNKPLFWLWSNGRAVRLGNWKLVSQSMKKSKQPLAWELYNLAVDKTETNNLVEKHPDIAKILAALYQQWLLRVTDKY
jgi:arylsulfatase A-like enzyme